MQEALRPAPVCARGGEQLFLKVKQEARVCARRAGMREHGHPPHRLAWVFKNRWVLESGHAAQGAPTCWFSEAKLEAGAGVREAGGHAERAHAPATMLLALERTIQQRRSAAPGETLARM